MIAMKTDNPKQSGKVVCKRLHDRLVDVGILDELLPRILATMPETVQEAHSKDASLLPMFRATASEYAMGFAFSRLAVKASTIFTKRFFGLMKVPDKQAWGGIYRGRILEYATDSMKHPATRGDILEKINEVKK